MKVFNIIIVLLLDVRISIRCRSVGHPLRCAMSRARCIPRRRKAAGGAWRGRRHGEVRRGGVRRAATTTRCSAIRHRHSAACSVGALGAVLGLGSVRASAPVGQDRWWGAVPRGRRRVRVRRGHAAVQSPVAGGARTCRGARPAAGSGTVPRRRAASAQRPRRHATLARACGCRYCRSSCCPSSSARRQVSTQHHTFIY